MSKFIDNIRQQSEQHKNRVIWIITGIVVALLLIVWAIVGIPQRNGKTTDVIDQFNSNVDNSKDALPKLFDNPTN